MKQDGKAPQVGARQVLGHTPWLPDSKASWRATDWTVLDLETTGLEASSDEIISVGLVRIHQGHIQLETAWNSLVSIPETVPFNPNSVIVHGLVRGDLEAAPDLAEVLRELTLRAANSVVVAHMGALLDQPFLERAFTTCYGRTWPAIWMDTARLAAWFDDRAAIEVPQPRCYGVQRLPDLLKRYGLPPGQEHDALGDALSAAQLFLVLANRAETLGVGTTGQLLKMAG